MGRILLTGISKTSSALPRGATALKERQHVGGSGAGRCFLMAVGGTVRFWGNVPAKQGLEEQEDSGSAVAQEGLHHSRSPSRCSVTATIARVDRWGDRRMLNLSSRMTSRHCAA
jgi:hypothetical protein